MYCKLTNNCLLSFFLFFYFILEASVKFLITAKKLGKEKHEAVTEFLTQAVHTYVKFNPCSKDNIRPGLRDFIDYLDEAYSLSLAAVQEGSVLIILGCHTLEGLELLWRDSRSGHLEKVAERYLFTEEIKRKLNSTICLKTVIEYENYSNCRKALMKLPRTSSGEYKQNVREIQLCCTVRRFCLAFQFQECTIYKKYIGRTGRKPNFVLGFLSFPISAPVHDDSAKFRHYCKDTKNGLPLSYVFRGIYSRKWYRICGG